jgi:hypothetical protein
LHQNKNLFNLEHANDFFFESEDLVTKEIRSSWYMFAYRFLPCVNSDWLKCITGSRAKLCINMFKHITVSDEAFARWVLECKREKVEAEVTGPNREVDRKFEKPKGSHDSNKYMVRYLEIYEQVKLRRTDKNRIIYNNWFWTYFKKSNSIYFKEAPSKARDVSINQTKMIFPNLDDDINVLATTTTYDDHVLDDFTNTDSNHLLNEERVTEVVEL